VIKQKKWTILIALNFSFCFAANAHGDLSERIRNISKIIIEYPDSIQLYHQRGVLYTQHGNFDLALIDLAYCQKWNYTAPSFGLDIATVLFHVKKYDKALLEIEEILCLNEQHTEALRLKGKTFFHRKEYVEAAFCFEKVIQYSPKPKPENYIEASKAWQLSNHSNANCFAQQILEEGISSLKGLIALRKELIQLHLENDDLEDAISLQYKILQGLNRKEHAYYQLALIKIKANMIESAHKDLQLAKQAIQQLPNRFLSTKAIQNLNYNINQILVQK